MKTEYFNNDKDSKYIESNNIVYKVTDDHFLQLSPWKQGDDRRVYEIDNDDVHVISYDNACMIVNKQFANTVEKWNFNGKQYIANALGDKDPTEHSYLLSMLPNHKVFNKVNSLMKDISGNSLSISSENGMSELKLIRHKGKIYYILIINDFLPRVKAYDLFGKFCQWCNIKHCKPIYCLNDKKYI